MLYTAVVRFNQWSYSRWNMLLAFYWDNWELSWKNFSHFSYKLMKNREDVSKIKSYKTYKINLIIYVPEPEFLELFTFNTDLRLAVSTFLLFLSRIMFNSLFLWFKKSRKKHKHKKITKDKQINKKMIKHLK